MEARSVADLPPAVEAAPVTGDRIAIADGVRVGFVSREEWEAAAYVLVEVDRELTDGQFAAVAEGLARTGLANLEQTIIFDRTTRVRLVPGEAEWQRRLAASEARVRELERLLAESDERAAAFQRILATRPAAKAAPAAAVGSA